MSLSCGSSRRNMRYKQNHIYQNDDYRLLWMECLKAWHGEQGVPSD